MLRNIIVVVALVCKDFCSYEGGIKWLYNVECKEENEKYLRMGTSTIRQTAGGDFEFNAATVKTREAETAGFFLLRTRTGLM